MTDNLCQKFSEGAEKLEVLNFRRNTVVCAWATLDVYETEWSCTRPHACSFKQYVYVHYIPQAS